jgi:hypothetical protein
MVFGTGNMKSEFVIIDGFRELWDYTYISTRLARIPLFDVFLYDSGLPVFNCTGLSEIKLLICVLYN